MPEEQSSPEKSFPTVGRWLVTALPPGWIYVTNFGVRQMLMDPTAVAATISLGQDDLTGPEAFGAYVANQVRMIAHYLLNPAVAGPQATSFNGAAEAKLFFVRHTNQSGAKMLHAQTYVRRDNWVGIVMLTTPEEKLQAVRPDYDAFLKGLRITDV